MASQGRLREALRTGSDLAQRLNTKTGGLGGFVARADEEKAYKSVVDWHLKAGITTFASVEVLCANQFYEDAVALARTIFEKELAVEYLALSPREHLQEFDRSALLCAEGFHGKLERSCPGDPLLREIEKSPSYGAAKKVRQASQSTAQWPNRALMAERIDAAKGMSDYTLFYRTDYAMMCDVSHSGPNVINVLLEFQPGGVCLSEKWHPTLCSLIGQIVPRFINLIETATRALGIDFGGETLAARARLIHA